MHGLQASFAIASESSHRSGCQARSETCSCISACGGTTFRSLQGPRSALSFPYPTPSLGTQYHRVCVIQVQTRRSGGHAVAAQLAEGWPIWACLLSASTSAQVASRCVTAAPSFIPEVTLNRFVLTGPAKDQDWRLDLCPSPCHCLGSSPSCFWHDSN